MVIIEDEDYWVDVQYRCLYCNNNLAFQMLDDLEEHIEDYHRKKEHNIVHFADDILVCLECDDYL